MNTGLTGFMTMLFLMGRAVQLGVRGALRRAGLDGAILLTASIFVVMYMIYAYVDIAWDTQSMLFLGGMLALIDRLPTLLGDDDDAPSPTAATRIHLFDSRPPSSHTRPLPAPAGARTGR
jgi:hypothetical protein